MEKISHEELRGTTSSSPSRLAKSSSELECRNEFPKFAFDSVLLGSNVYRRTCESSWVRKTSTGIQNGNESSLSSPNSVISTSNSAIVSEGIDSASSSGDFGVTHWRHSDVKPHNNPCWGNNGEQGGKDVFKISELGLTELRGSSLDPAGPKTRSNTEACEAPKLRYPQGHPEAHRLHLNLEIWSFGCIILAFACWLAIRREEPKEVELLRYGRLPSSLDYFANVSATLTNKL